MGRRYAWSTGLLAKSWIARWSTSGQSKATRLRSESNFCSQVASFGRLTSRQKRTNLRSNNSWRGDACEVQRDERFGLDTTRPVALARQQRKLVSTGVWVRQSRNEEKSMTRSLRNTFVGLLALFFV